MGAKNDYLSNWWLSIGNWEVVRIEIPDEMHCKINIIENIYGQKFNHQKFNLIITTKCAFACKKS